MREQLHSVLSEKYSDYEIARIRYAIICVLSEASKFLIMLLIFSLICKTKEFIIALIVLLSIRNFTGGIHLKHYMSCLCFSIGFLAIILLSALFFRIPEWMQTIIMGVGVVLIYRIGPISSDSRPELSEKQKFMNKLIACSVLLFYICLFLFTEKLPFQNLIFWVIFFQIMQLCAAKIIRKRRFSHETL